MVYLHDCTPDGGHMISLTSRAYTDVEQAWRKTHHGGVIICKSPGAAVNFRYRMYRYRKALVEAHGESPFDELIIRIDGPNLTVTKHDQIQEIIPDADSVVELDQAMIFPAQPFSKEEIASATAKGKPFAPDEIKSLMGRPPLTPELEDKDGTS